MFALCTSRDDADKISDAMKYAAKNSGFRSKTYVSRINRSGPKIIG
jgi:hypothetical protein